MIWFNNKYDFREFVDSAIGENFENLQGVGLAICSYFRGYMSWPKIRKAYEDFKPFFGHRSFVNKRITPSDFKGLTRKNDPEQMLAYELLAKLYRYQDQDHDRFLRTSISSTYSKLDLIPTLPLTILSQIVDDAVDLIPVQKIKVVLNPEVRNMIKLIKTEEKYKELPILADMLEDFHYGTHTEYANHFRQGRHTFACKYLRKLEGAR